MKMFLVKLINIIQYKQLIIVIKFKNKAVKILDGNWFLEIFHRFYDKRRYSQNMYLI